MINVDPEIIYTALMKKCAQIGEKYIQKEKVYLESKLEYDSLSWWKKMFSDERDWPHYFQLPNYSDEDYCKEHRNIISACEYAIKHNIKTIELPLKYCYLLT